MSTSLSVVASLSLGPELGVTWHQYECQGRAIGQVSAPTLGEPQIREPPGQATHEISFQHGWIMEKSQQGASVINMGSLTCHHGASQPQGPLSSCPELLVWGPAALARGDPALCVV